MRCSFGYTVKSPYVERRVKYYDENGIQVEENVADFGFNYDGKEHQYAKTVFTYAGTDLSLVEGQDYEIKYVDNVYGQKGTNGQYAAVLAIAKGKFGGNLTTSDNGINVKDGVYTDAAGNKIAFSGSMNESSTAMSLNYETIDVFRSWYDEGEAERVRLKENAFYSIWSDCEPSIRVLEFPKITDALIEKYRKKTPNFNIDQEQFPPRRGGQRGLPALSKSHGVVGARIPQNITLHDYQKQAISAWVGENYRGIFDMATGTGKTFTGLGAISKISEDLDDELKQTQKFLS